MGTELERPIPLESTYVIDGEEWVAMRVDYQAVPGERTIQLTLQPVEEVKRRFYR